jgi:hypothetical protein
MDLNSTETIKVPSLDCPPTVMTTAAGPTGKPTGRRRRTWRAPETAPGALPAYSIRADFPAIVAAIWAARGAGDVEITPVAEG